MSSITGIELYTVYALLYVDTVQGVSLIFLIFGNNEPTLAAIISLPNGHFVVSYTIELIEIYSFGQNELKKEFSTTATGKDAKMCVLTKNRFATLGYGEKKIKMWNF